MCNARRIRLRCEAQDESSARNSVSCVTCNVTALRYAIKLQVWTHLKAYVCSCSAAEMVGPNPARGIDVCLL